MITILGIDPGSRITGYGLIRTDGNKHQFITADCINNSSKQIPQRLEQIFSRLSQLIEQYQPDEVAIEDVFMHINPRGALKLGQARGAAITAAAVKNIPLFEYSARQVKKAVVGYGAATKNQIQHMVCQLLKLDKQPQEDAADALAIAISHAHMRKSLQQLELAKQKYKMVSG